MAEAARLRLAKTLNGSLNLPREDVKLLILRDAAVEILERIWELGGPEVGHEVTEEVTARAIRHLRRARPCIAQSMQVLGHDNRCIECVYSGFDYCLTEGKECRISGDQPVAVA